MSWKFSLRRKTAQPVLINDFKKTMKPGDYKRIQLMNMVKEGKFIFKKRNASLLYEP